MDELVECIVKRKLTMSAFVGRCFSISIGLMMLLLTWVLFVYVPAIVTIAILADVAVGFMIYFVFRNTNVEFEYDFFAGELTIDKIMNKSKRKRLKVFNFSQFEYMAPSDSKRFGNLDERGNAQYLDYSTHNLEDSTYTAVFHDDSKLKIFVTLSPNEDLLKLLKKLYSRQMYEE